MDDHHLFYRETLRNHREQGEGGGTRRGGELSTEPLQWQAQHDLVIRIPGRPAAVLLFLFPRVTCMTFGPQPARFNHIETCFLRVAWLHRYFLAGKGRNLRTWAAPSGTCRKVKYFFKWLLQEGTVNESIATELYERSSRRSPWQPS